MMRKTLCVYATATYSAVACGVVVVAMISVYVAQTNYTHQHRHHAITCRYDGMAHAQTKRTVTPYSHALLELSTSSSSDFLFGGLM